MNVQNLVACRYNPSHRVKNGKLLSHEDKCPDRKTKALKVCPYNPVHKVAPENYDRHKRDCPHKPEVDKQAENELKDYLKKLKEKKDEPTASKPNAQTRDSTPFVGWGQQTKETKKESIKNLADDWDKLDNEDLISNKRDEAKSVVDDINSILEKEIFESINKFEYDPNETFSKVTKENKNIIMDEDDDDDDDIFNKIYKN